MSVSKPPAPIWCDFTSGLTVWVNRDLVEFTMPDGWSGRLTAMEALANAAGFAAAIKEAESWIERWDATTGRYRDQVVVS